MEVDWKERVYMPRAETITSKKRWRRIRNKVVEEAGGRCAACLEVQNSITVHHILPREQGGKNYLFNLIVLCLECHDYIEPLWQRLSTKKLIKGSMVKPQPKENLEPDQNDWRSWVYGGCTRL